MQKPKILGINFHDLSTGTDHPIVGGTVMMDDVDYAQTVDEFIAKCIRPLAEKLWQELKS